MMQVNLPVSILREGKSFIAYTPALDLSTSGRTYEEARRRFREIVGIFLEEIAKKGQLENTLRDLGWTKTRARWTPPVVVSQESQSVNVPSRA
jgi:predicted RNase H-like HicB family nuclease